jgi:glucose-6-phosphate 1-dehydrogenase
MTDAQDASTKPPAAANAFVVFGATGDLAGKMIVPALMRIVAGTPPPRIVAVGSRDDGAEQLRGRMRAQVVAHDASLAAAFDAFAPRIAFVGGDLASDRVFADVAKALGSARNPVHYLAIPPSLFERALDGLVAAGLAGAKRPGARVAIEKPFGHDLASAQALEAAVARALDPSAAWRIDHFLAKDPVRALADLRAHATFVDAPWRAGALAAIEITMAEAFGVGTRGAFYERTGVLRDVFQNHLLELVAIATMDPCAPRDAEAFAAARIAALRAIAPLAPGDVVYGQYDGYRDEPDVARGSDVATFLAVRLASRAPRAAGVPIVVRAGKSMALTATTLTLHLAGGDRMAFRLGPGDTGIAIRAARLAPHTLARRMPLAIVAKTGDDEDRDAYVNILAALRDGDHSVSERAEGVFAAWRVVEPVLAAPIRVHRYARGSMGPAEADRLLPHGVRWLDAMTAPVTDP